MSAECSIHGTDLRYAGEGWPPEMYCIDCALEAAKTALAAAAADAAKLRELVDEAVPLIECEYAIPCVVAREKYGRAESACPQCDWLARAEALREESS